MLGRDLLFETSNGEAIATRIASVASVLARHRGLTGPWTLGDPPTLPGGLELATITQFVQATMRGQYEGAPLCWLTAIGDADPPTIAITVEPSRSGDIVRVRCSLPPQLPSAPTLARLVGELAALLDADQAYVDDPALAMRYFLRRINAQIGAPPPVLDEPSLDLLTVDDFDRRCVPAGVFWINYWSATMVATLGETRVRKAGWFDVLDGPNRGLVLVATKAPLDAHAHRSHILHLLDALHLRAAQETAAY